MAPIHSVKVAVIDFTRTQFFFSQSFHFHINLNFMNIINWPRSIQIKFKLNCLYFFMPWHIKEHVDDSYRFLSYYKHV